MDSINLDFINAVAQQDPSDIVPQDASTLSLLSIPNFALVLSALSLAYFLSFVVHRPLLRGWARLQRRWEEEEEGYGVQVCWEFVEGEVCPLEEGEGEGKEE